MRLSSFYFCNFHSARCVRCAMCGKRPYTHALVAETFADMIRAAGFKHVTYTNMSFGVVALHSGFKV